MPIEAGTVALTFFLAEFANSTEKRQFTKLLFPRKNVYRALVNFTTREFGLSEVKAYSSVYLGEPEQRTTIKRSPYRSKTSIAYKYFAGNWMMNPDGSWIL